MKTEKALKEETKREYNRLVAEYFALRNKADIVLDKIHQIEGLVEYEK